MSSAEWQCVCHISFLFPNAIEGVDHNLLKALKTCAVVNKDSVVSYEYLGFTLVLNPSPAARGALQEKLKSLESPSSETSWYLVL